MAEDMEEALAKSGADLFREIRRLNEESELEDYYKGGAWRDDLMRLDLQLLDAHRREGGAPDPPDLEDVPMPELPKPPAITAAGLQGVGGAAGLQQLLAARIAALRGQAGLMGGGGAANGGGAAAELRLVALFVAKWKLDPTRTKVALAQLSAVRRRFVIQTFKTDPSLGMDATEHLETYIAECDLTNKWAAADKAAATGPSTPGASQLAAAKLAAFAAAGNRGAPPSTAGRLGGQQISFTSAANRGAPPSVGGLKRPLLPPSAHDPAKRARLTPPIGFTAGGAAAAGGAMQAMLRARQLAAQQAGTVRPALALGGPSTIIRPPVFAAPKAQNKSSALATALQRQQLTQAAVGNGWGSAVRLPATANWPTGQGGASGNGSGGLIRNLLQRL